MNNCRRACFVLLAVAFVFSEIKAQPYQISNPDFEVWDTNSISLPVGWNSYCNANCYMNNPYANIICGIITSTSVHEKKSGASPQGNGKNYLILRTQNVNGGGLNMAVSGLMSNGLFNIGSISVYTPQNYFSTERSNSDFCQPLQATPDSMYIWIKYYAFDDDTSRARIVAYLHGDTDFQYMNHIQDRKLYTAYINHLIQRTDTVASGNNWIHLKLPFIYDGYAIPKYLLIYLASDSCIMGGHIGNTLCVDNIQLVYSSWLDNISVDSIPIPNFRKDSFNYHITFPAVTSPQYVPHVTVKGEVDDIYDSIAFIPSAKGLHGAKSVITVTGEDHHSQHVYTITYEIEKSDNAELSAIFCDTGAIPNFHADTLQYNVVLPAGTHIPPIVTAITSWPGLTPRITQASTLPGDAVIEVTAENGIDKRTYTVHFSVALSNDATAAWICYNQTPIPGFHKDSLNYSVELPYGTQSVQLTAAASWSTATIQYHQITTFPGTASVTVIAEDHQTKCTYWIHFSVAPNNDATLDSIGYHLSGSYHTIQSFSKKTYQYVVFLPEKTHTYPTLKAVPADTNATVRIQYAQKWNDTTLIWVIAENGTDSLCYRIFFYVLLSKETRLSSISVDNKPLATFRDTVYQYQITLDSVYFPKVSAELKDKDAHLQITMPLQIPGSACLTVIAEDTGYSQSYWIHFSLPHTNSADLIALGYYLGNNYRAIVPFHKDTLLYHVTLPELTTTVPVLTSTKADFYASDTIVQPASANDCAYVRVFSENRQHIKTYRVCFNVAISQNADLDTLYCNGIQLSQFHKDTLVYHVPLHYDSLYAPVVSAHAASSAAKVSVRQAVSSDDTAWIQVIAQDSTVSKTYLVAFNRQRSPVTSLLQFGYSLQNSDSVVDLQEGTTRYRITLKAETPNVPYGFRFVMKDPRATLSFLHIPTSVEDTLAVRVVSERGCDTVIYLFAFFRQPSDNVLLDTIWINDQLMFGFSSASYYECAISSRTTGIPVIQAKAAWEKSEIHITPPVSTFGSFQIRVVAEDKIHYKVYTFQLRPKHQENRLRVIFLNEKELLPYFHPDTLNYIQEWSFDKELHLSARTMDTAAKYAVIPLQSLCMIDYYEIRVWAEDRDDSLSYFLEIRWKEAVEESSGIRFCSYPNPAHDNWNIEVSDGELPLKLTIYNAEGRKVSEQIVTHEKQTVFIANLPQGIYVYKLEKSGRTLYRGKLVKR